MEKTCHQKKRERELKLRVIAIMRQMTTEPSFDLRRNDLPIFDRRRSCGGEKPREEE